jgi:TPP-dependent pyruvate/acetoin dehydrogenase alpha subunit
LINNKDLEKYRNAIEAEIIQAVEFARNSPNPTFEDLLTDVI